MPPNFTKVEQGFADVGPLHTNMRIPPLDLRTPINYDAVYRGLSADGFGGTSEYFARISGAVTAVFPRSVYIEGKDGTRSVEVPAGTVFYIGDLPEDLMREEAPKTTPPMPRPPTLIAGSPDSLTELPFDPVIENALAQRRAQAAAELILKAAAAEKSHRTEEASAPAAPAKPVSSESGPATSEAEVPPAPRPSPRSPS